MENTVVTKLGRCFLMKTLYRQPFLETFSGLMIYRISKEIAQIKEMNC